jgi:hypothetical protein
MKFTLRGGVRAKRLRIPGLGGGHSDPGKIVISVFATKSSMGLGSWSLSSDNKNDWRMKPDNFTISCVEIKDAWIVFLCPDTPSWLADYSQGILYCVMKQNTT